VFFVAEHRYRLKPHQGEMSLMKFPNGKTLGVTAMLAAMLLPAAAQTTSTTTPPTPKPQNINQRKENQQDRIAQGIQSGQLTAGETANLEKKESNLNKEVSADRKANSGTLTQSEKAQVNKQQNHLSKQIYKDKHNGFRQKP
jgi:hypothetical protein